MQTTLANRPEEDEKPETVVIAGDNYGTMRVVETTERYDPDVPEDEEESK